MSSKRAKFSSNEEFTSNDFLKSLKDIENCQEEMKELQDKTYREILKLEQKMECEKKPIYAKREEAIYQIPNFWLTAVSY